MKKCFFASVLIFLFATAKGQVLYFDVLTAPTIMTVHNSMLYSSSRQSRVMLKNAKRAEELYAAGMTAANQVQEKIVNGLHQVSGTVRNALTAKDIAYNLADLATTLNEIRNVVQSHPHFIVVATPAINYLREQSIMVYADVGNILSRVDERNLMDAGDRQIILNDILTNINVLRTAAFYLLYTFKSAIRKGFLQSLNPFATWVNQDRAIMQDIIRQANYYWY